MTAPHSELAWRLADFIEAGVEPPRSHVTNPEITDGEMMTDDEIQEFLKHSIATLRILSDKQSPRYNDLEANYLADLIYLLKLGRITEDDYNDLTHPDNLRFNTL